MNTRRKRRRERTGARLDANGFSLIELLIVVAIILILAVIAIPNLLKSRMAANEASAVSSIRTFTSANVTYSSLCPTVGYPATLTDLGPGAGACTGGANIVDPILGVALPVKAGFVFTYSTTSTAGTNVSYTLNADPSVSGMSGQRHFFCNETGVIRYNLTAPATVASNSLQ
jgi:type IV pilus assembly protein PilA